MPITLCEHVDRRVAGLGRCNTCYQRHRRHTNPHYANLKKANKKRWKISHPEQVRLEAQRYRATPHGKLWAKHNRLKTIYGISPDEHQLLHQQANHCCQICGQNKHRLVVDHDHDSGMIRGVLCDKCNRGLGFFDDNPVKFQQAIDYLKRLLA